MGIPTGIKSISVFLPTPSVRRATVQTPVYHSNSAISTHALREEGDA